MIASIYICSLSPLYAIDPNHLTLNDTIEDKICLNRSFRECKLEKWFQWFGKSALNKRFLSIIFAQINRDIELKILKNNLSDLFIEIISWKIIKILFQINKYSRWGKILFVLFWIEKSSLIWENATRMDNSITSIVIFFFFSIKDPRASIQKILILIIILIIIIVSFQLGDPSIIFIYYTMMIFKMQFHEFYQLIFFTIILQFATNDHFYEQFLYSKFRVIGG